MLYDCLQQRTKNRRMTADEFKESLAKIGWKQSEFARRTGLTPATVSRWARGEVEIPKWVAHHLQLLLDVRRMWFAYVFQDDPAPIAPPEISKYVDTGKE